MVDYRERYIKENLNLYENQKRNVKALVHKRRCILSDKAGAGKTCSCLYAFAYLKAKGYLSNMFILTPLSAYEKKVWDKDVQKFFKFTSIDIADLAKLAGDNPERLQKLLQKYDIIYGKHSNIKQTQFTWLFYSLRVKRDILWVIDEIHELRNPSSSMNQLYREVTRPVSALWGVTATSISRNVENLYNIVNLVYPYYLGTWTAFRDLYCTTENKIIGYDRINKRKRQVKEATGLKDPEALRQKLEPIFITGASFLEFKFHYVDYQNSEYEESVYNKIAKGIAVEPEQEPDQWFKWIMQNDLEEPKQLMGNVERFSSRFIYLQMAADGIIDEKATYNREDSVKMLKLIELLKEITSKRQSVLVYFDYLASVEIAKRMIEKHMNSVRVLLSTGEDRLKDNAMNEGMVKLAPHIVLCTRASAASTSYYYINNVIFFHNPTIPSTFVQFAGRIRRKNTLYPDDLNCYIFRSDNIDLYKYCVCVEKTVLQEQATGESENSVPEDYKQVVLTPSFRQQQKKTLLWKKSKNYETI